jgi:hypothetical protein
VGNLASAIDELEGEDLGTVPLAAQGEELVELFRERDRLEAECLRRLARFDAAGGAMVEGARSTRAWLRHRCRMAPGAASERVRVARRLEGTLSETRAAFAAGDIGYDHARVIARTVDASPACAESIGEAEPILVEAARECDPLQLRRVAEHWRHMVDRDRFEAHERAARDQRRLHLSETFQGRVVGDFEGDAETGAIIRTAVEAYAKPRPGGDDPIPAQRRYDAFVSICERVLDQGLAPTTGGVRPHLNVFVSLETLEARARAAGAELDWLHQPISGAAARRLACDAQITRIITGPDSMPPDVGRTTRVIPPALRRAVIARDRHCTEPGCDVPAPWCEIHHRVHWVDGGETKLPNLELKCKPHHHDHHPDHDNRGPPS